MSRRDPVQPDAVDLIIQQWRHELPDVDASPMEIFGRIHRVFQRYQVHLTEVFNSYGINNAAFDILAALRRCGAPYRQTAGALADTTLVTTGGITLRVDRLEQAGLVLRERDAEDRRVVYVQLTDQGLTLINDLTRAHFANEERLLIGLTATERTRLAGLMSKLERSLDLAEASARTQPPPAAAPS